MKKIFGIILPLAILFGFSLYSQSEKTVRMFMNGVNYPEIELLVSVRDSQTKECIYGLEKPDFSIFEKGIKQKITSFRAIEKGGFDIIDLVFLIDNTGSMSDEITAVKNNARLFADILSQSKIDYQLALITFSDEIENTFDFTSDIEKFKKQISSIDIVGGGDEPENGLEALKKASELNFRKNARKAFILITDAPYHEKDRVTELAMKPLVSRFALRNIHVYPIAIKLKDYLWMAHKTNGVYYSIKDDFSSIIEEVANGLTSQYKLGYITSQPCSDGAAMDVKLDISSISSSTDGKYKRPLNLNQLDLDFYFDSTDLSIDPQNPIECDTVTFFTSIKANSCSDTVILENIVLKLFDVKPGERIEIAKSEPFILKSKGEAKDVLIEWNTRGFRGDRKLELVIDPGKDLLEKNKGNNILKNKIKISEVAHDLYIESIDYTPRPAGPCDIVRVSVKINDGTNCNGVVLHDIELEGFCGSNSIGKRVTSITVGSPEPIEFEWDAAGTEIPTRLKFIVDPQRRFGEELSLENNVKEILVDIRPVKHDLLPVSVLNQTPKHPREGDTIVFDLNIEDKGHCPNFPLGHDIFLRLLDKKSKLILGRSKPFRLSTGNSTIVPIEWKTKLRDQGNRELSFIVDPQQRIRELTPPGRKNNILSHSIEILPMPHDLIIENVEISPENPVDGEPATIKVRIRDDARFPGVRTGEFKIKAFDRYTRALVGRSVPVMISSQQSLEVEFPFDTGGMAGDKEIRIVVDPDKKIEELTPKGLDGENNNEFILRVKIAE